MCFVSLWGWNFPKGSIYHQLFIALWFPAPCANEYIMNWITSAMKMCLPRPSNYMSLHPHTFYRTLPSPPSPLLPGCIPTDHILSWTRHDCAPVAYQFPPLFFFENLLKQWLPGPLHYALWACCSLPGHSKSEGKDSFLISATSHKLLKILSLSLTHREPDTFFLHPSIPFSCHSFSPQLLYVEHDTKDWGMKMSVNFFPQKNSAPISSSVNQNRIKIFWTKDSISKWRWESHF